MLDTYSKSCVYYTMNNKGKTNKMKTTTNNLINNFSYEDLAHALYLKGEKDGVHKITGVELDHPVLRMYRVNDDNTKILAIIEYSNKLNFSRIGDAGTDRKNGTIYISHEHINTVRKAMYAFLNGDAEKAYSFFDENSRFHDINEENVMSFEEIKARDNKIFANWTMTALDESGYPDYLEYDWRDSNAVQSWWNMRMTRNSDGKEVVLKVLFFDWFGEEGKIIRRFLYWNGSLLK